jgi:hypothetical protein
MRVALFCLAAGLVWPVHLIAAPATTQPANAEVESLIAQLSSDRGPDRQRAQDRLVDLGMSRPEVEARVRQLLRDPPNEEAGARAQAALRLITENRVVGPTPVTMHLKNVDPGAAFAALSKETGIEISPEPPDMWVKKRGGAAAISIEAEGRPFWDVFRELCALSRVEPDFSDNGRLKLIESPDGKWAATPAVVGGPVLIQAVKVVETRSLEFAAPNSPELNRQLSMTLYVEPKLRVLADAFSAKIDTAVDDKGVSLLDPNADGDDVDLTNVADTSRQWQLELGLTCPPKGGGRKIATLRGALRLKVPTRIDTLEVPDVLNATEVTRSVAGRRFTFHRCRKVKGGYEVKVTCYRDALRDAEWQQFTTPRDFVRLTDNKGLAVLFVGVSEQEGNDKETTLTLQFENPNNAPNGIGGPVGRPARLMWEIPSESKEMRLTFEFNNLTLP